MKKEHNNYIVNRQHMLMLINVVALNDTSMEVLTASTCFQGLMVVQE